MAIKPPGKSKGARLKVPPVPVSEPGKEHLTISLRYLRPSHCLSDCEQQDVLSFADKVRLLTQKSWMEIGGLHRHGLGYEKIARNAIRPALPTHITDDVNIIAFRFSGHKPMIGYKSGETFYVLWFDRGMDVYDHG